MGDPIVRTQFLVLNGVVSYIFSAFWALLGFLDFLGFFGLCFHFWTFLDFLRLPHSPELILRFGGVLSFPRDDSWS